MLYIGFLSRSLGNGCLLSIGFSAVSPDDSLSYISVGKVINRCWENKSAILCVF